MEEHSWSANLQPQPLYMAGCISNRVFVFLHWLCFVANELNCHVLDLKMYGVVECQGQLNKSHQNITSLAKKATVCKQKDYILVSRSASASETGLQGFPHIL